MHKSHFPLFLIRINLESWIESIFNNNLHLLKDLKLFIYFFLFSRFIVGLLGLDGHSRSSSLPLPYVGIPPVASLSDDHPPSAWTLLRMGPHCLSGSLAIFKQH